MPEVNLLGSQPKLMRDVSARLHDKRKNRAAALKFGREYFDGSREQGYGGYHYDGRWQAVARRLIEHFGLRPGMRVLDVGCAKGYLVKDLRDALRGLSVWGLDISQYALANAHDDVAGGLVCGSCDRLPWPDRTFDLVLAINTVHNLARAGCIRALQEIERVGRPGQAFVQVDAFRNADERALFEAWMLTAKTYCNPEDWLALFEEAGYTGDYYWTILEADPHWIKA